MKNSVIVSLAILVVVLTGMLLWQSCFHELAYVSGELREAKAMLAKALAHIGVLQRFEEEGIPVDGIVGTSGGAMMAGLMCRVIFLPVGDLSRTSLLSRLAGVAVAAIASPKTTPHSDTVRLLVMRKLPRS